MATVPLYGINPTAKTNTVPTIVTEEKSVITPQDEVIRNKKAQILNSFFAQNEAPLESYGMEFVLAAEKNNLDWRLLPAIAMRETTGGKHACKNPKAPNNYFGWLSCKTGFSSIKTSIDFIAMTLSGNNPDGKYYTKGMTTEEILKKYNPDYIIPGYSKQVIQIMKMINPTENLN